MADHVEEKYSALYEQQLDPFAEFHARVCLVSSVWMSFEYHSTATVFFFLKLLAPSLLWSFTQERQRGYARLNAVERLTFRASELFLGTKAARLFLFCYLIAIHLFMGIMMYTVAHWQC